MPESAREPPRPPARTVTFLFTDVEGSTRLLAEHGAGYVDRLAEHRHALRDAFARHDGVEVDTQGDAFFVTFPRATDAVPQQPRHAARWTAAPIRVHMGVHTGPLAAKAAQVAESPHPSPVGAYGRRSW